MQKKSVIFLLFLLAVVTMAGCGETRKLITVAGYWPHERPYLVVGRVMDLERNPVENCKVILIKRKGELSLCPCGPSADLLGEFFVASTDQTGYYSFIFEPRGANDVWAYFDAQDKGYEPRFVDLNHFMGPTFMQTPGNSPIVVDLVMEQAS